MSHCLTVLLLSLAFSLNGQEVEISIDHPVSVNAGEDFTVTLTIKKGSLTDYSRFSQDLPLGLSATNVSAPNADFSFDEQRVRIIWLKLPEANEIAVSYLVSVDPRLKGSFNLGGVFAYVVEDERKFLNIDKPKSISIVPNSALSQSEIVDIKNFKGGKAPVAPVTPVAAVAIASSGAEPFAMAIRQKPELLNTGGYMVNLLIKNPGGSKYAKIEETFPSGYLFEEVNSNEGIVSNAASTVKFIWMKLPAQSEFEVVYRLVPKQNEPQGTMQIGGLFTYTDGDENRVVEIKEMDLILADMNTSQKKNLLATGRVPEAATHTAPERTETTPPERTETRSPERTETRAAERTETRAAVTPADMGGTSGRTIANTKVLDKGTGVYYRVQLTANLTAFDANTFYRELGVQEEVLVEQHNGYYKYTTGPFQTYDQALSYKDRIERIPEIEGAFVVGYRNGNRVSSGSIR